MDVVEVRGQIGAACLVTFVDPDRQWEIGREAIGDHSAVSLLVEEIAPAAYGLSQGNGGQDKIGNGEEMQLLHPAVDEHAQHAADYCAIDRKAAVAQIDHAKQYLAEAHARTDEHIEGEYDVVDPGEYHAEGNGNEAEIDHAVLMEPAALGLVRTKYEREYYAKHDKRAIPIDLEPVEAEFGAVDKHV